MREIKFRVWDNNSEIMYYSGIKLRGDGFFEIYDKVNKIFSHNDDGAGSELILMQYTGLKDKNGQEIYEGDFVEGEIKFQVNTMKVKGRIIYNHCRFVIGEYNCELYQFSNNFNGKGIWIEKIGNIYENPELLEANHEKG